MKNLLMIFTTGHRTRTAGLAAIALLSFGCGNTAPGSAGLQAADTQAALLAQTGPTLGLAGGFTVLAGTAVTCTGSTVTGDVGVWPVAAITQTSCTINNGTTHLADESAKLAFLDFDAAYQALAAPPTCPLGATTLSGNLAGLNLGPGIYCVDAASTTTDGTLTLTGGANDIWIFKIGTSGTGALTGTNFSVVMAGGQACNVYWWVRQAATMTTSAFKGTILAGTAIDITGGTFDGDALAHTAVTMSDATVSGCGPGTPSPGCKDFVTGGGWIDLAGGRKATFAVSGGFKHGRLFGQLTYVDHAPKGSKGQDTNDSKCVGIKVKGTGVTAYTVTGENARHIEGTADINGKSGYTYQVDVVDNGEPGIDDKFSLSLSNGCSASSGEHLAGNIQLHKKCRPLICAPFKSDEDDDEGEGWHEVHDGRD